MVIGLGVNFVVLKYNLFFCYRRGMLFKNTCCLFFDPVYHFHATKCMCTQSIKINYCMGDWVSCHQSKSVITLQALKWNKVTLMFALGSSVVTKILSGTICLYSVVKGWYMYTKLIFRCIASNRHLDWSALMVGSSMLPCTFCSGLPHCAFPFWTLSAAWQFLSN